MIIPLPNRKILDPIIRAAKRSAVYIRPLDDIIELGAHSIDGYSVIRSIRVPGATKDRPISVSPESFDRLLKAAPKKELLTLSIVYHGDAPWVAARAGNRAAFDLPAKYVLDSKPPCFAERLAGETAREIVPDPALLAEALGRVLPAMSKDATRPHIHGILLEWYGWGVRTVATNGHWLALSGGAGRAYTDEDVKDEFPIESALIPGAIIPHILRDLRGAGGARVETDDVSTRAEILDEDGWVTYGVTGSPEDAIAPFPWRKIVPDAISAARSVTLSWDDLLEAVRMVEPFGAPNSAGSLITLFGGAEDVRVCAESEIGRTHADVPAEVTSRSSRGREPIGLSSKYLLDALGAVASDEDRAEICIYSSPIDPVVLVSADRENLAVVMPVRI